LCALSATSSQNNITFDFYIAKNGVVLNESEQVAKFSSSDQQPLTLSCTVSLSTNDYIEVWVANEINNSATLTPQSLNLSIK